MTTGASSRSRRRRWWLADGIADHSRLTGSGDDDDSLLLVRAVKEVAREDMSHQHVVDAETNVEEGEEDHPNPGDNVRVICHADILGPKNASRADFPANGVDDDVDDEVDDVEDNANQLPRRVKVDKLPVALHCADNTEDAHNEVANPDPNQEVAAKAMAANHAEPGKNDGPHCQEECATFHIEKGAAAFVECQLVLVHGAKDVRMTAITHD